MAVVTGGCIKGDKVPAFVSQVVEIINVRPPQKAIEMHPALFPGYMIGVDGPAAWQIRLNEVCQEIDNRMQVLHNANLIWRRVLKNGAENTTTPMYYRHNDRRKIVWEWNELPEEIAWLPFFEITPFKDERFPIVP